NRMIEATAPITVARDRKPAFSSACPRVGSARIATQTAAEDAASSWSQKAAYRATTMAIQIRHAKAQALTGAPAMVNGRAIIGFSLNALCYVDLTIPGRLRSFIPHVGPHLSAEHPIRPAGVGQNDRNQE